MHKCDAGQGNGHYPGTTGCTVFLMVCRWQQFHSTTTVGTSIATTVPQASHYCQLLYAPTFPRASSVRVPTQLSSVVWPAQWPAEGAACGLPAVMSVLAGQTCQTPYKFDAQ